jgi:hypothetical protein
VGLVAGASAQSKAPVRVIHTGEDNIGARVTFEVKEGIRASRAMNLIGETTQLHVRVSIISLSLTEDGNSHSALSVVYSVDGVAIPLTDRKARAAVSRDHD